MNEEQKEALKILKISKGQIEAAIKMMEEDRYCIEVSNQIMATQSLLKKANLLILKQHMNHCVIEAFKHDDEQEKQEKLDEIITILSKIIGK
ncbi:metal-sensing transcriptional repressor [Garciella nitratireducens]|uniref:Copper-sensing transcriptional repressor CsoR n=1 Tax=Garciella nitratireducens DSM 15102 TaxID=1121911 RepID=A0A1T4L356_9FIRM|nr:metal-sensing transcriptional repressor [Garciella nitratireducens]RBP40635.1 DNA-binding FrmR family transcriptional regulator [Garciella nitratireducens]SJZ49001.1 DNA-binding transcriptional regulator, FrmR family [Garciella nitratireducens DSM 15102]